MLPWVVQYQPKSADDIPQSDAVKKLREFLTTFAKQKKKAALVYGPSGTGKTIAVHCLAKAMNHEIVEVNASDFRNKEQINAKVGQAVKQRSLFFESKVILVDEVDGVAGQQDRGGISALADIIKNTTYPIVMTANNPWDSKFSSLRKLANIIEFPAVGPGEVFAILKAIAEKENIVFDELALKSLARRCGGDLRGAIIDLQVLSQPNKKITQELVEQLGERDRTEDMIQALTKILKQTDPVIALTALDHVEEDLDEAFLWLEENIPKEYTNHDDLCRAFDALSRADVFRGRIRRWQHWRFLVYVSNLLTAGVAAAKDAPYRAFVKYSPTQRILKLWIAKQRYALRKQIAEKIAEKCHCSRKRAIQDVLPYVRVMMKNKDFKLDEYFRLEDEEVEWLAKA